jgi:hypothetical protein
MSEKSNSELVRELLDAFTSLKQKMEDPNYLHLENAIDQLVENQKEMKQDLAELKKRLLNPYDGAIVELRKNTEFRQEQEKSKKDYEKLVDEHKSLMRWKSNIQKIVIAVLSSGGAIAAWFLSQFIGK